MWVVYVLIIFMGVLILEKFVYFRAHVPILLTRYLPFAASPPLNVAPKICILQALPVPIVSLIMSFRDQADTSILRASRALHVISQQTTSQPRQLRIDCDKMSTRKISNIVAHLKHATHRIASLSIFHMDNIPFVLRRFLACKWKHENTAHVHVFVRLYGESNVFDDEIHVIASRVTSLDIDLRPDDDWSASHDVRVWEVVDHAKNACILLQNCRRLHQLTIHVVTEMWPELVRIAPQLTYLCLKDFQVSMSNAFDMRVVSEFGRQLFVCRHVVFETSSAWACIILNNAPAVEHVEFIGPFVSLSGGGETVLTKLRTLTLRNMYLSANMLRALIRVFHPYIIELYLSECSMKQSGDLEILLKLTHLTSLHIKNARIGTNKWKLDQNKPADSQMLRYAFLRAHSKVALHVI